MASTNNANFSLLSQNEIDVLVKFLLEKKETLGTDVMNQKSIDKLIMLFRRIMKNYQLIWILLMPDLIKIS